jgi:transposase
MITSEHEATILRLYHAERWKIGTIAAQLGVHHSTVRRVITRNGAVIPTGTARPSLVDPYVPFIIATLEKYPKLTATRLYEMTRARGFKGGPDHFRTVVTRYRPRPKGEPYPITPL